jgi:predicted aspartyl protease
MRSSRPSGFLSRALSRAAASCLVFVIASAPLHAEPEILRLAPPPGSGPEFAIPTTNDRAGRIVVEVLVNGLGPYRFIVDTGANRSVISQRLAQLLALPAGTAADAVVHGITGFAVMPQVQVSAMRVGTLELASQKLAVLPDLVFGDTDGILGIDALQQARIDIDFARDEVIVRRSSVSSSEGRLVVRAKVRDRGLMLVAGKVGRVRVKAIIDTGAQRTLGNEALRQALALRADSEIDGTRTTVIGATAQTAEGLVFAAPTIWLGSARLQDLPVTFGDFHVFRVWSLQAEPALVIGMDVLGWLPQVTIDYPRRELQLRLPDAGMPRTSS